MQRAALDDRHLVPLRGSGRRSPRRGCGPAPSSQPVDRRARHAAGPMWPSSRRPRASGGRWPWPRSEVERAPSSRTTQRAGANRRASAASRTGSSIGSRRRACGSSTQSGSHPRPRQDLGGATPCGGAVGEQHHPVGQRHRAGGPGEHDGRRGAPRTAAARAAAPPTCPPVIDQTPAPRDQLGPTCGAVPGDDSRSAGRQAASNVGAGSRHPGQVPLVERAAAPPRRRPARAAPARPASLSRRVTSSSACAAPARPAARTAPAARSAHRAVVDARRRRSSRVARPSTSSQRCVQPEVDRAAAEQRVQLGVVGLALRQPAVTVARPCPAGSSVRPTGGPSRCGRRCGPRTCLQRSARSSGVHVHGAADVVEHAAQRRRSRGAASARTRWPCSRPRPAGSACPAAAGARRSPTRRSRGLHLVHAGVAR